MEDDSYPDEPKERVDHDRLFKELIGTFFEEFMLLFFPKAYESIDFEHTVFLSEELYTDIVKGEKRRVDLLVETRLKGEQALIIIHVEPQSYVQPDFQDRMFVYFSRLYEKYRRKILPIAIFSYDKNRDEQDTLDISFPFFDVMKFQYLKIELKKQNWRDYLKQDNPVAAALLSKMGYTEDERVKVKVEFLRMLVRLEQDPARTQLLTGFFETYLKLSRQEEQQFEQELNKLKPEEAKQMMEITTSWHKKGRAEGRAEGLAEGVAKGKAETAKNMLMIGMDKELIAKVTGLSKEQIDKLQKELH
ncbi:transposase [Ammoniphilus oxalaticus]|uniref:Transposase n=2 Tax=Ammoniphilus oxalaticus TaxID=66863 RepID=A0A419SNF9_9BACL|nr:transposase [Ammoniphilus oxalaticus]